LRLPFFFASRARARAHTSLQKQGALSALAAPKKKGSYRFACKELPKISGTPDLEEDEVVHISVLPFDG
jgi:hypothetical protein